MYAVYIYISFITGRNKTFSQLRWAHPHGMKLTTKWRHRAPNARINRVRKVCQRPSLFKSLWRNHVDVPSGKSLRNYGKSPLLFNKSTISTAIFNSYVKLPESILAT